MTADPMFVATKRFSTRSAVLCCSAIPWYDLELGGRGENRLAQEIKQVARRTQSFQLSNDANFESKQPGE
jgi:hypothetical protein